LSTNQDYSSMEPTFERFTVQILSWAFGRIEQDAQRRGLPSKSAQSLICSYTISYLEKSGGKRS